VSRRPIPQNPLSEACPSIRKSDTDRYETPRKWSAKTGFSDGMHSLVPAQRHHEDSLDAERPKAAICRILPRKIMDVGPGNFPTPLFLFTNDRNDRDSESALNGSLFGRIDGQDGPVSIAA